ncbi:MAG: hypothetical protein KH135_05470, partial [Firmicutes bacterium]|nr:hypothetical protein [Bacillota bacterium]
ILALNHIVICLKINNIEKSVSSLKSFFSEFSELFDNHQTNETILKLYTLLRKENLQLTSSGACSDFATNLVFLYETYQMNFSTNPKEKFFYLVKENLFFTRPEIFQKACQLELESYEDLYLETVYHYCLKENLFQELSQEGILILRKRLFNRELNITTVMRFFALQDVRNHLGISNLDKIIETYSEARLSKFISNFVEYHYMSKKCHLEETVLESKNTSKYPSILTKKLKYAYQVIKEKK